MKSFISVVLGLTAIGSMGAAAKHEGIVVVRAKVHMDFTMDTREGDFQSIQVEGGQLITASPQLRNASTKNLVKEGFAAVAKVAGGLKLVDCDNAVLAVTGGEGNFLPNPNGEEIFRTPVVLAFVCVE